jgi:poly(A) polymerase
MIQLLNWFQTTYPHLKQELLESHHNFDNSDTNPYHVEGDCWSHTMMVCKVAQLKGYDRVVQVSALLHDIGKPKSRKINPRNNYVNFHGHEELSAIMAKPLVDDLVARAMLTQDEADEVVELIALHSFLYRHSQEEIEEYFKDKLKLFKHLSELSECDDLGRFSETMREIKYNI